MKKIMVCLLSALLIFLFTACGGAKEGGGKSAVKGEFDTSKMLDVSDDFLKGLDGFEMTIVYPWAISDEVDTENGDYQLLQALQQKYGFTVKSKGQATGYETAMITSVLAGTPFGNVMLCPEDDFVDWFSSGIMADLSGAAEKLGIDFKNDDIYNPLIAKYTNIDGAQYGYNFGYENAAAVSLFYNKRILEENSLTDPHALLESGEWTWSKLREYAQKCQVANADGTVSVHGFGSWTVNEALSAMMYSNDGSFCRLSDDGTLVMNIKDSKTMEAMQTYYEWCNTDKLVFVSEGGWKASMQDFVNGSYAFMLGTEEVMTIANSAGMEDEYGIINFPIGPSNTSGNVDYQTNLRYWFVPTTYEKDADKYLFIMDMIRRLDARSYDQRFEEQFALRITDEKSYKQYSERLKSTDKYDMYRYSGLCVSEPGLYGFGSTLYNGSLTPGAMVEQLNDSLTATLNDLWAGAKITG